MTQQPGRQQVFDHRLRDLVRRTGDLSIATGRGVPRSAAAGWLRRELRPVVSREVLEKAEADLRAEVVRLRRRVGTLSAVVRLLIGVVPVSGGPSRIDHGDRPGVIY